MDKLVTLIAFVAAFLVSMDFSVLSVAVPTIQAQFGITMTGASWPVLGYLLALTGSAAIAGNVYDRLGCRRTMMWGFALFGACSAACGFSGSVWTLSVFRFLQGLGGALMYVAGPASVEDLVSEGGRRRAFSAVSAAPAAGVCLGPAVGGFITAWLGWQWIFYFNIPFCVAGAALALRVPQPAPSGAATRSMDLPGTLLSFVFLGLGTCWLSFGQENGWASTTTVSCGAGGAAAFAAFVARERRAAQPALDLSLFSVNRFFWGNVSLGLFLVSFGGLAFLLPFLLEWEFGLTTMATGGVISLRAAATVVFTFAVGVFARALGGSGVVVALGCGLVAAGLSGLAFFGTSAGLSLAVISIAITGAGTGFVYPVLLEDVMDGLPAHRRGMGSGVIAVLRLLAQTVGIVGFETIFSEFVPVGGRDAARAGITGPAFAFCFWVNAVFAVAAVPAFLACRRASCSGPTDLADSVEKRAAAGMAP